MLSSLTWIYEKYDDLVKEYSGKYILYDSNEILLADESFSVVYEEYKKIRHQKKCKMVLVDDGEATLYGINL